MKAGAGRYRELWSHYVPTIDAIWFVIDSADLLRMDIAKTELENILSKVAESHRKPPILFLANKSDLPAAASVDQIAVALDLEKLVSNTTWAIMATNAVSGTGVQESLRWTIDRLDGKSADR